MLPTAIKYILGLSTVILSFFQNKETKDFSISCKEKIFYAASISPVLVDTPRLDDFFADSLHIGRKRMNKIEISKYNSLDSNYVIIKFFSKKNSRWVLKNKFKFEKDDVNACDPKLDDFNNDGLNDLTYRSMSGARGANEIRKLFVYNRSTDKLLYIKNSEDYPNMLYNKELNCIDAFLVYGGCSTVFLRLNGNRLQKFASVELYEGLTVREYDKNGKEKIIFRDENNKEGFIRYSNYKPLKE